MNFFCAELPPPKTQPYVPMPVTNEKCSFVTMNRKHDCPIWNNTSWKMSVIFISVLLYLVNRLFPKFIQLVKSQPKIRSIVTMSTYSLYKPCSEKNDSNAEGTKQNFALTGRADKFVVNLGARESKEPKLKFPRCGLKKKISCVTDAVD